MREFLSQEEYLSLIERHKERFSAFRELLLFYNRKFNLTSLTEEREILYKHFLDSVQGESLFPEGARVVEVGSGAGFPSIPLKIVREDLSFTLLESTGKKCEFLRTAIGELGLGGMEVLNMRAEDAGREERFRERFDVCCARAVARLNTLSEYCLPLVKRGGGFVAYKGEAREELKESERAISLLGGRVEKVINAPLPEEMGERTLILIRKERQTPAKYPRGKGKERRDPII